MECVFDSFNGIDGIHRDRNVLAWNDRCLANGEHARVSCDNDAWADADVVAERFLFPDSHAGPRSLAGAMDIGWGDEGESAQLLNGRDAASVISRIQFRGCRIHTIPDRLLGSYSGDYRAIRDCGLAIDPRQP